jgi:hypothetical protein
VTSHQCVAETLTLVSECERVLVEHLKKNDGKAEFPALFDLAGKLIAARLVATRVGSVWSVLKSDSPDSKVVAWFNASSARNPLVARRHDAAHGYYIGSVMALARVALVRYATHSLHVAIVRNDGGFSRRARVLDNGCGEGIGTYYGLRATDALEVALACR